MKQTVYLLVLSFIVFGCKSLNNNTYQGYDIRNLTIGMSKDEVFSLIGPPERVLSISRTSYGYEEVLQYRTAYNEFYALEFVNDYLESADYIYEEALYPVYPPTGRPGVGKPVFPPHSRPGNLAPPQGNNRPGNNVLPPAKPREPIIQNNKNNKNDRNNKNDKNTTRPSTRESTQPDNRPANTTTIPPSNRSTNNSTQTTGRSTSTPQNSNTQQNTRSSSGNQDDSSGSNSSRQSSSSSSERDNTTNGGRR
jgi:hypothetical protein